MRAANESQSVSLISALLLFVAATYAEEGTTRSTGHAHCGSGLCGPATYYSPSGDYGLFVEPDEGRGYSAATYRMEKDGVHVWSEEKSYTLREVSVTDRGEVMGFAYRKARERAGDATRLKWFLHIVALDARGNERLNHVSERRRPRIQVQPAPSLRPYVRQFLADPSNDRIVVRVAENEGASDDVWEVFFGKRLWRLYSISDGQLESEFNPMTLAADVERIRDVLRVDLIKGTPLLLVHLWVGDVHLGAHDQGARFLLVDSRFRAVWSLDLPSDYSALCERQDRCRPDWYLEGHPAILHEDRPRHFSVCCMAANQRLSFSVAEDADGRWAVSEVGRVDLGTGSQGP